MEILREEFKEKILLSENDKKKSLEELKTFLLNSHRQDVDNTESNHNAQLESLKLGHNLEIEELVFVQKNYIEELTRTFSEKMSVQHQLFLTEADEIKNARREELNDLTLKQKEIIDELKEVRK